MTRRARLRRKIRKSAWRQEACAELLTPAELGLTRQLAAVHNAFCALPDCRPGEHADWTAAIHRLQDIVMSRAAARAYPAEFTGLSAKPPEGAPS